jgi:hypothetical protein
MIDDGDLSGRIETPAAPHNSRDTSIWSAPMKLQVAGLAVLLAVATLTGQAPGLTNDEVDAAIAAAKQAGFKSSFVEARGRFAAFFTVIVQGPVGRTMDLAREHFDTYKPLKASDVPGELRAHAVTFSVLQHGTGDHEIKNVVVLPAGASRDNAVQSLPANPSAKDALPRTWRPKLRGAVPGKNLFFRFAENTLPAGDLQIIVVSEYGDERYTVKAEERDRIR